MELLRAIEGIRTPFLDTVVGLITRLGEETIGVVLLCVIFWCISKKFAYVIGVVFFLSGLTVQGMKICFRIERPWVIDPSFNPVEGSKEYATGYSFPSGHTQSAASLYGAIGAQVKQKWLMAICFIIPVLVAFSRMYLGVHTLLDVVVSLAISAVFILLTVWIFSGGDSIDKKRELIISLVMIAYACVVSVIAVVLRRSGTIEIEFAADALKAAGACIGFAVGMYVERVYIDFPVKAKNLLWQVIKLIIGIVGVLIIQEGLKIVLRDIMKLDAGIMLAADMVRYFLMLAWVTLFYPLIIKRFFVEKAGKKNV